MLASDRGIAPNGRSKVAIMTADMVAGRGGEDEPQLRFVAASTGRAQMFRHRPQRSGLDS